jgi:tripartite-type tricarboxylate transporter receptor subunit TctC
MKARWYSAVLVMVIGFLVIASSSLRAQDFYKGKTIRLVVGFSAGGGFDTYSRLIARHIGSHIPGKPTVIVENMTGAGSRIAANQLYKVAKPDGLTMANFMGSIRSSDGLGPNTNRQNLSS